MGSLPETRCASLVQAQDAPETAAGPWGSARASKVGGISSPSALAVLMYREVAELLALENAGGVDAEQAMTLVRICCSS